MSKYFIAIGITLVGVYLGFITFNHVHAWAGIFLTLAVIGVFLNYIYKQFKKEQNEKN
jgi:putative Mn2+ efflux pump MntP